MKRILIVSGPPEARMLHDAFLRLGYDSRLILYSGADYSLFTPRWLQSLYRGRFPYNFIRRAFNHALRTEALPRMRDGKADFMLIFKGSHLDEDNYEALRDLKHPLAFWANDSVMRYPHQRAIADLAAVSFFIDGGDVARKNDVWLPVAYVPRDDKAPERGRFDISIIGRIGGRNYQDRRAYFQSLAGSHLTERYACAAACGVSKSEYLKYRLKYRFPVLRPMPSARYNSLIASSAVCINIHQNDGIKPINPMFFNIPGLGVCQVAEDRDYLAQWLEPWKEYVPVNREDFLDVLERVAADRDLKRRIAEAGRKRAESEHTFAHRAATMARYMAAYS